MDSFSFDIFENLAKRAWKISWVFILYSAVSFMVLLNIIIEKKLYILSNIDKLSQNYIDIIIFLLNSALFSILFFIIMYVFKGDSDMTIRKLREKFYESAYERVKLVFKYRFETNDLDFDSEIKKLVKYNSRFEKDGLTHTVSIDNLNSVFVEGIDSLYIYYKISEEEYILYSVWHSGDFVAVAVAIKQSLNITKEDFEATLEKALNLEGATYTKGIRDDFYWFDVKYSIAEDFLFSNIEKERISRKVAHIVTISIPHLMENMQWKKS